ncbi:MAG: purine-nucleoside phosphorylase [Kiritimatiellae bacterium]|nr:purine-nucleoside phosphorylase [Kiritimatiellia bacterium]
MDFSYFDRAAGYLPDVCFERRPDLGIMLGSGWGDALKADAAILSISYSDIPGFGASTVAGHAGEFRLFQLHGKIVAAWCGRRHYYEGVGWEPVVLPVEMLRRMGCEKILLTNAAGGIDPGLRPGDFVVIRDHVNLLGLGPLIGPAREEWGPRFPDMTAIYTKHLAELLHAAANRLGIRAKDGVYAFNAGPCYETPAEIRAYAALGASVVGMSTVPEAVFAKACGMKVAGVSLVSNLAAGIAGGSLSHEEVVAAGTEAKLRMAALIGDFVDRL